MKKVVVVVVGQRLPWREDLSKTSKVLCKYATRTKACKNPIASFIRFVIFDVKEVQRIQWWQWEIIAWKYVVHEYMCRLEEQA